ncbi:MAG: mechanosensitive ion channel [Myxococcales bacterium]|nr:mechanosensitive ion channel [Myxococcales bacterium]
MTLWEGIASEASDDRTLYLAGTLLASLALVKAASIGPVRVKGLLFFFAMHLVCLPIAGALRASGSASHPYVQLLCLVFGVVAAVGMCTAVLFGVVLPLLRLRTPRILQDIVVAGASLLAVFGLATRLVPNLTGLIATSAVLTAVIGLSLQDALTNLMGGLALQLDNAFEVGDWVKVGEVVGRVTEIRWRYTAVETRNWETAIIPNSALIKNQVMVLGRRHGQPVQLRRWVYFNVDFRHQPSDVIEVADNAVRAAKIDFVAREPAPNCVLMELHDSTARYALRYWLTDLAADDPTDSQVRTCLYFALKRAGIPLSIPAHALFVTEESQDRKALKSREDLANRLAALGRLDLFRELGEEDRADLAKRLRYAPFTNGEVITRQGAEAHWLYLIIDGEVSVRVSADNGLEREVARLRTGDFFGEMSLMTGERRSATVVALRDVECYRLDKNAFEEVIRRRPELAEDVAEILARRRRELTAAKEGLDQESNSRQLAEDKRDILGKIRQFFGLSEDSRRAAG